MQVFSERISSSHNGRPLPLARYLGCDEAIDPFALHFNGQSYRSALQSDNGFSVVNALLLGGVDVDARDGRTGDTALHIAVRLPRTENTEYDTNHYSNHTQGSDGKDMYEEEEDGFGFPCRNSRIISFLLDNGADANARNLAGETVLMIAAATANTTAVEILFTHGADVSLRDTFGRSALSYAAGFPHLLQKMSVWVNDIAVRSAKEELLHEVCRRRGSELAALFLIEQFGLDVNAREGEGLRDKENLTNMENRTNDHVPVQTMNKSNINANGYTNKDTYANERGNEGTTSVSVCSGSTPLHCAVLSGSDSLVRILLMKGADIDRTDSFGVTPLQLASTRCTRPTRMLCHLRAFACAGTAECREKVLKDYFLVSTSLRELNTPLDVLYFLLAALLPHVGLFLFAALVPTANWLLVAAAIFILLQCASALLRDDQRHCARPLRGIGFFTGYAIVLCGTAWRHIDPSLGTSPRLFLVICLGLLGLCVWLVIGSNPGITELSAAQRAELHRALLRTRSARSEEEAKRVLDARRTLCRPLRAQHCRQLNRTVLRYDRYCTWLSSAIGAGNHKSFIALLAIGSMLLAGLYMYSSDSENTLDTAMHRCAAVYMGILLPLALFLSFALLAQQLWYISRGLTSYDVDFPSRCPWCFTLGPRVYSLYDMGPVTNLRRFFLGEEDLAAQTQRMPVMGARLQRIVRNYQIMECTPCGGGNNHSHGEHGHSHGEHGHSHGEHGHSHGEDGHSHGEHGDSQNGNESHQPQLYSQASPVSAGASEGVAMQLFQLMVQNGSASVPAAPAAENLRAELTETQWKEAETKATEMFNFFQGNLAGASSA